MQFFEQYRAENLDMLHFSSYTVTAIFSFFFFFFQGGVLFKQATIFNLIIKSCVMNLYNTNLYIKN